MKSGESDSTSRSILKGMALVRFRRAARVESARGRMYKK